MSSQNEYFSDFHTVAKWPVDKPYRHCKAKTPKKVAQKASPTKSRHTQTAAVWVNKRVVSTDVGTQTNLVPVPALEVMCTAFVKNIARFGHVKFLHAIVTMTLITISAMMVRFLYENSLTTIVSMIVVIGTIYKKPVTISQSLCQFVNSMRNVAMFCMNAVLVRYQRS